MRQQWQPAHLLKIIHLSPTNPETLRDQITEPIAPQNIPESIQQIAQHGGRNKILQHRREYKVHEMLIPPVSDAQI